MTFSQWWTSSSTSQSPRPPAVSVGSPIRPRANAELASVFCSAFICPNGPDTALAAGHGGGLFWLPAAFVIAIVVASANSWVLLVEVLR
ncbi:MAG: hypothetical protein WAL72_31020 [Streptosporangiaceae bacterium]